MQEVTGLYLKHIPYRETSVILTLYSKDFGMLKCVVKGIRARKKKEVGILQPFHFLTVAVHRLNLEKDLQTAYEVKLNYVNKGLLDIRKSTVAIFLTEILYVSLKYQQIDLSFYQKLDYILKSYDKMNYCRIFHIWFLLFFLEEMGVLPDFKNAPKGCCLNLENGQFEPIQNKHSFSEHQCRELGELIELSVDELANSPIILKNKMEILDNILIYFNHHIGVMTIRSYEVLKVVFE